GTIGHIDGALVRKDGAQFVFQFGGLNIFQRKNFDEALPAIGKIGARGRDDFGVDLWLLAFGNDEDGFGAFDGGETFESESAINQSDGVAGGELLRTDDGQLALDLRMFDDAFAGGLGQPLHDHIYIGALKADLDFLRRRRGLDIGWRGLVRN